MGRIISDFIENFTVDSFFDRIKNKSLVCTLMKYMMLLFLGCVIVLISTFAPKNVELKYCKMIEIFVELIALCLCFKTFVITSILHKHYKASHYPCILSMGLGISFSAILLNFVSNFLFLYGHSIVVENIFIILGFAIRFLLVIFVLLSIASIMTEYATSVKKLVVSLTVIAIAYLMSMVVFTIVRSTESIEALRIATKDSREIFSLPYFFYLIPLIFPMSLMVIVHKIMKIALNRYSTPIIITEFFIVTLLYSFMRYTSLYRILPYFLVPLIFLIIFTRLFIKYNLLNIESKEKQQKIMLTQIRPHFIYNVLSSIAYLCLENTNLAYTTVITFSKYLRQNLNSLGQDKPVDFNEELQHAKTYVELEQIRFPNIINFVCDIQDDNFKLPVLTLQPMVENAIKHGLLAKKERGGTVTVRTWEDVNYHMISVTDDGTGFDVKEFFSSAKEDHIGLKNTQERFKMAGHKFQIESTVGKGTTVTIYIAKICKNCTVM